MPDLNLVGYDAVLSWSATVADPASSAAGLAANWRSAGWIPAGSIPAGWAAAG